MSLSITDAQIREALAGLLATVEAERELLIESHVVLGYDCESTVALDDESAQTVAQWDAQIAAGKVALEELDRRAAELTRLQAAGGALV